METIAIIIDVLILALIVAMPVLCASRFIGAIFSARLRQKIRKEWIFHSILAATSLVFVLVLLSIDFVPYAGLKAAKAAKTKNDIAMLCTGILAYETEYDEAPATNKNATLVKILLGDNPRGIAFLSLRPTDMNAKGEMVDPWGKPFRISLTDPQHPKVYSMSPEFYAMSQR